MLIKEPRLLPILKYLNCVLNSLKKIILLKEQVVDNSVKVSFHKGGIGKVYSLWDAYI